YFEYMPWWYYSRDPRFREKFNRWIWRGGADVGSYPKPPRPPDDGPPKPPKTPKRKAAKPLGGPGPLKKEEIKSYFPGNEVPKKYLPGGKPSVASYVPQEPGADVKPSDTVPGTNMTWSDAVKNFFERAAAEGERQKKAIQGGVEEALKKPTGLETYV